MTKTKLDICNMALAILGQADLSSLTEDNQRAILCNQYYDIVRQQLLRAHDWNFSRGKDQLTLIREDEDARVERYVYNKPAKCLFVTRVFNDGMQFFLKDNLFHLEYDMDLKKEVIRTGLVDAWAEYILDIEDTSIFDSQFIEALAAGIATKIAMSLTGATNLYQLAFQTYQYALDNARYSNKVEKLEVAEFENPFLEEREK